MTDAPVDPDSALRTRLAEGGASFGVPLAAGAEARRDPTDASHIELDVSVEVPGSANTASGLPSYFAHPREEPVCTCIPEYASARLHSGLCYRNHARNSTETHPYVAR